MSSPRHLWSGDWELDSAAAREEQAKRRAQTEEPAGSPPAASTPRARPSTAARAAASLRAARERLPILTARATARARRIRKLRIAILVVLVGLLSAGAAFGLTTLLVGSGAGNGGRPYLGVNVVGSPFGTLVAHVAPGSPAAKAGLEPGDLITAIDNEPIGAVDDVNAALDRLHSGQTIELSFTRGPASFTVPVKLAARPSGHP